jgi:hypothetical protein
MAKWIGRWVLFVALLPALYFSGEVFTAFQAAPGLLVGE